MYMDTARLFWERERVGGGEIFYEYFITYTHCDIVWKYTVVSQ